MLEEVRPAAVVIEGPPELDGILGWAGDPDLVPPVAALAYRPDAPARSIFYPMASFSPEWVALRWAIAEGVPVRFADLAAAHQLAAPRGDGDDDLGDPIDPIGELAAAAGYADAERWWEDAVEHRHTAAKGFAAIADAISAIREGRDDGRRNAVREAAMRTVLRQVVARADGSVVVVCGAFHAPALLPDRWPTKTADTALLRGLPKTKVAVTWVPWTAGRLAVASGYGAGVTSPGWYDHCHTTQEDERIEAWMVRVARALRDADLPAATASAVEAARLATTLATLRGRPHAGLAECTDAALAVLCGGASAPLAVIHDEVVVGHAMGRVPDSTPQVPLAKDIDAAAKAARLRTTAEAKTTVLDLRTPGGLARSTLLHRLQLLGIRWGRPADVGGTTGTFKEAWTVCWQPELAVAIIEASVWGATLVDAATARAVRHAADAPDLTGVVAVLTDCLPADLPDATAAVVREVDRRAATTHDALVLMAAAEPLAVTCRYGDVRQLDTARLRDVLDVLVRRVAAGLAPALAGLDDDEAARARTGLDGVARAIRLLDHPDLTDVWLTAVARLLDQARIHPGLVGRIARLLVDHGRLAPTDAADRMSRELSPGRPAREAAAWVDGFLDGDAALLLLDPALLGLVDAWVAGAPESVFDDLLPLLRRTFARYAPAERHQLGRRLRHGPRPATAEQAVDPVLAGPAVDHVRSLLGARGA